MRRGLVTAAIVVAACCVPEHGHAAVHSPVPIVRAIPPDAECSRSFVGALHIDEDGTWFECVCEMLRFVDPVCDWYEITTPAQDPRALRRRAIVMHHIPAAARRTHTLPRMVAGGWAR